METNPGPKKKKSRGRGRGRVGRLPVPVPMSAGGGWVEVSRFYGYEPRTTNHTLLATRIRSEKRNKGKERKKGKERLRVTKLRNDISSIHDPHFPRNGGLRT